MMGPNGTSLLEKLGFERAHLMAPAALLELVRKEQLRRSTQRAIGRVVRENKGKSLGNLLTLQEVGIAPALIAKIRIKYPTKSDLEIIKVMREKGIL